MSSDGDVQTVSTDGDVVQTEVKPENSDSPVDTVTGEEDNNANDIKAEDPPQKEVEEGPDALAPATNSLSTRKDEAVQLRLKDGDDKPYSMVTLVRRVAAQYPDLDAMVVKRKGQVVKWTFAQYHHDIRTVAKAFIKLGLEPFGGVGILGFNSPEWFLSDLAAIFAGGVSVGIYATNSPEACQYVLEDSQTNVVVVENDQQLQKILQVRDTLPNLKAVVQWDGPLKEEYPDCMTWHELMDLGGQESDDILDSRIREIAPNKCATIMYTSGTTARPKGVMLSHDNITWVVKHSSVILKLKPKEVFLTYLPLSHAGARLLELYFPLFCPGTVHFAQPDALKGSLGDTMKEVRPTVFFGVPRVWEKIAEKMQDAGQNVSGVKKKIGAWAKDIGYRGNINRMNGRPVPFGWFLANALVFKKVKAALGLDRAKILLTAAAPISAKTNEYFLSVDITLLEIYGMTECSGPQVVSGPEHVRLNSVGPTFVGAETRIDSPNEEGVGEICMKGRHVMMGYLNKEEQTKEVLSEDGWLRSGDLGRVDEDGFVYITGRSKEMIITSGGENMAPVPIEERVKEELSVVSQCMVIGDKRKFLSLLLTLKTEVDSETTEPRDELTQSAREWCKSKGSDVTTVSQILETKDADLMKAIQEGIDRVNERAISRAQKIQKWSILPTDFSIPGGELSATMKTKRSFILEKYSSTIEAFYEDV